MKKITALLIVSAVILSGCGETGKYESKTEQTTEPETAVTTETTALQTETTAETVPETTATTTTAMKIDPIIERDIQDGELVRILDYIPDAEIDLRYSTTNNFTGVVLYDDPEAYICYGTVKKLMKVQEDLKELGYRILIWDAYRSPEAQQKLWEVYPDPNFVADPRNGLTNHSRGGTLDISIVYADGSPVEMPSAFDEFSAKADRNYYDVSEEAGRNATLLEEVMTRNGFHGYIGEWWDYTDNETPALIISEKE